MALDALVDLDPCSAELREHRIEVANGKFTIPCFADGQYSVSSEKGDQTVFRLSGKIT